MTDQLKLRRRVGDLERQTRLLETARTHFEHFAEVVAHDVRSPLVTTRGFIDTMREDHQKELSADCQDILNRASKSHSATVAMPDDLITFMRSGSDIDGARQSLDDVDLRKLFAEVRQRVDLDDTTKLSFEPNEVTHVRTHGVVLEHILLNLINNAVKYIGHDKGRVRVKASFEGADVLFCVIDNGPGIDEGERKWVFRPFSRGASAAGTKGSGFGLAMSQRLALSLGGSLELRDKHAAETTGCHFTLRLPS